MSAPATATDAAAKHVASAGDAVAVAERLAEQFGVEASARDADRDLPHEQVRTLKGSGLLALSVPAEYGGVDAPATVVTEVFRLLAHADPSLAQIPQSHFAFLEALRLKGTGEQKAFFYDIVRAGGLFANAQSERGPHPIDLDATTLTATDSGEYVLSGRKFYSTGALFADWLIVRASVADGSGDAPTSATPKALAFIARDAQGLQVVDDWDGMGQRTTASGTVTLDDVLVPASHVVPFTPIFAEPTVYGAHAQLLHAAIDVGIATGALAEGVRQAATARPHFEARVASAAEDPTLIHVAGELAVTVRGAQALLAEAARHVDGARADLTPDTAAAASVAVAVAKVAAVRASLDASSGLFELGGTRSASAGGNLSRYWRDARTHTLHDATRWKLQHIGRYVLSGTRPPRHGQL
ncbi:MAG: SfnB family sulfur acquisition oxidoreductase [Mycobacterium sp.]